MEWILLALWVDRVSYRTSGALRVAVLLVGLGINVAVSVAAFETGVLTVAEWLGKPDATEIAGY